MQSVPAMAHRLDDVIARNRTTMLYAWRGASSLAVDNEGATGDLRIGGFFFRQTRYLSRIAFLIDGERPLACSAAQTAPHELELSYIFPPVSAELETTLGGGSGSGGVPSRFGILTRSLDLRLAYRVHHGALEIELAVANRWNDEARFTLEWLFDADFAAVAEVLDERMQEAPVTPADEGRKLVFRYGHETMPYRTSITMRDAIDWKIEGRSVKAEVTAARGERTVATLVVEAHDFEDPIGERDRAVRAARAGEWLGSITTLRSPAESPLVTIVNRAVRDLGSLALMEGKESEWLYPGAGVPLYLNHWGRDGLTTGWQAGAFDRCEMLRNVLARLAPLQGVQVDDETEEQPGRILNREELTPTARLGLTPYRRFYGDFASPFMFIIALGQFFAWTGDRETLRGHWDTAVRVLDWARRDGDSDGDGFLEYVKRSSQGPRHQGWKDSENAIVREDGTQVGPPIAVAEIQAYWYTSLQFMSVLGLVLGERRAARRFWREAVDLKKRFNRDFWVEEEGCVALGLDADKRQIRTVASNAGHCLAAGIIATERIPRVVERLFAPDMFSGWGIRTMTTDNPAYNPLDYHLGSLWPVENGTILFGLRRYGFDARTLELARALYDLAMIWPGGRIPECVGGYARDEYGHPGAYPQANAPQAWNQSTWVILMQALLGLQPAASLRTLAVDPILPEWLPEVTLENLRVGEGSATIRFWRDEKGASRFEVLEKSGALHVVRQQPINAMQVHWWSRLRALAR